MSQFFKRKTVNSQLDVPEKVCIILHSKMICDCRNKERLFEGSKYKHLKRINTIEKYPNDCVLTCIREILSIVNTPKKIYLSTTLFNEFDLGLYDYHGFNFYGIFKKSTSLSLDILKHSALFSY